MVISPPPYSQRSKSALFLPQGEKLRFGERCALANPHPKRGGGGPHLYDSIAERENWNDPPVPAKGHASTGTIPEFGTSQEYVCQVAPIEARTSEMRMLHIGQSKSTMLPFSGCGSCCCTLNNDERRGRRYQESWQALLPRLPTKHNNDSFARLNNVNHAHIFF